MCNIYLYYLQRVWEFHTCSFVVMCHTYFYIILAITSHCFTTATVYFVKPDNSENCPHQHCHVLQHYTNKQLDPYSQLHFLSGIFHLSSDFVLRDVHNISLTGSKAANSTPTPLFSVTHQLV